MPETHDHFDETTEDTEAQTRAIRQLNDYLRMTFSGGRVVMTQGVQALSMDVTSKVIDTIRAFDSFTEDNDPYGTHEFGMFDIDGQKLMFKIDCYDKNLEYGSPDPANPDVTTRVMTILLASEY